MAATDLRRLASDHLWLHFTRMGAYSDGGLPVIVRGDGCYLYDQHDKRYLDALAGLFAVQIGYSYGDEIGQAAHEQMRELPFYTNWSYAHPRAIELAHEVARLGVSEATIRARYARLVGDDILQVVGVTNPLGLGFDAVAMVGVRTNGPPEDVAETIMGWREADYVVVTAGRFDLVVEVVTTDRENLLELTNRMRALEGVASTETFFYLEMWKQLYDWGTRVDKESE